MLHKKRFIFSLLGLTVANLLTNINTHKVIANEGIESTSKFVISADKIKNESVEKRPIELNNLAPVLLHDDLFSHSNYEINNSEAISHQAVDLIPKNRLNSNRKLTYISVDLDKLCKTSPDNLRCSQYFKTTLEQQPSESEISKRLTSQSIGESNQKASGWAVTPEAGTLVFGAFITKSLTSNLNARVGLNTASIALAGYQKRKNEVTYDANLNLFNVSTLVDYHPFKKSGFRVTGGLVFNDNNLEGKARIKDGVTFEYDGNRYTNKDIASVKAKVSSSNNIAPYLGIGWGNAVKPGKRWGFSANLGVVFSGSPQVDLDANIVNDSLSEQINRDLRVEEKELEDDLNGFKIYPVLSLGVSYHF
ncbi:hypothetical protein [Brunnivagina elsteri]|uniref:Uncharacterized protein n=1 Tax=Brunnivagina elsteri CCALA 953 TaxID=987040 RepID=A0A2A2TKG3_9CYAN|nr:hypothetical protein [Calothrix elsteri]PAX57041.1 hypothetical protein CK510_09665 [Calothrix elsteri CCALA 953]